MNLCEVRSGENVKKTEVYHSNEHHFVFPLQARAPSLGEAFPDLQTEEQRFFNFS